MMKRRTEERQQSTYLFPECLEIATKIAENPPDWLDIERFGSLAHIAGVVQDAILDRLEEWAYETKETQA